MPGPAFLCGDRVTLTPIEEADIAFLQSLVNDPAVWRRTGAYAPKNAIQEEAWFEAATENEDAEHLLICVDADATTDADAAIDGDTTTNTGDEDGESAGNGDDASHATVSGGADEPVGTVGLHDIDGTWGGCELGYFVAPEYWDRGYATEAVDLVCGYAFGERRLHKVSARAFADNPGSRRVLEKVGFVEEGVHRDEAFVGGEYVDTVYYGLLASEHGESGCDADDDTGGTGGKTQPKR